MGRDLLCQTSENRNKQEKNVGETASNRSELILLRKSIDKTELIEQNASKKKRSLSLHLL